MYHRSYRSNTCRIVILTSIVWAIIDLIIIVNYDQHIYIPSQIKNLPKEDKINNNNDEINYEISDEINGEINIDNNNPDSIDNNNSIISVPLTYDKSLLNKWKSPPIIEELKGIPGEMGEPVIIPEDMEELMKEKFEENQFNLLASDVMSLNRSLPDVRNENCQNNEYPEKLPTTSIVIVFHNEAWSTLLRTIWSVINRSPRKLLKEIILVDDYSDREYLGEKLNDYIKTLPVKTFLLKTIQRSGLVKARLLGAKYVSSEIITFLDAHCECSEGWLEPLLSRISQNRQTVVCPIIDVISDETFEYIPASDAVWGGFNWHLNFRWYIVSDREMKRRNYDHIAPINTPVMAGGLFSIDKQYFYEIGSYDEGMDIWGGENLEMSFRIWQCGGILEIIPCSHVGHVFRDKSPYTFPGGGANKIVSHNIARVVDVWLDEWKDLYYSKSVNKTDSGDISDRIALREKLKCKNFKWYLETIYPETSFPLNYYYLGEIRNVENEKCIDTMGRKYNELVGLYNCHGLGGNQLFLYTKEQQIMSNDLCLDGSSINEPILMNRCNNMGGNQKWYYNDTDKTIRDYNSNCLQPSSKDANTAILQSCDSSIGQQWLMESKFKWQAPGN